MDLLTLLSFAGAFLVFAASPGPDNMTIVARTLSQGPAAGVAYGAGTVTGILVFLVLAALGLSVLSTELGGAMTVLRLAGAAWLVWIGVRLWTAPPALPAARPVASRRGLIGIFVTGVALNLGNPKMPLFYLALLPQVVGPSLGAAQIGMLAAVIVAVEVVVVGGHVLLALRAQGLLRTPGAVRRANRIAGGTLIGAGVLVAAR